jgi:hypothetical protein
VELSFSRTEQVDGEAGYRGPAAVCRFSYRPVAGYDPNSSTVKFLSETREMEVWFAPVSETPIFVPYRVSIPTSFGTAVIKATQFVTMPQSAGSTLGGRTTQ